MCCLFGFYDYGGTLSAKQKNRIISALAISSEIRGTDATGIAYRTGTKLCIYKRPFPARWMRFRLPAEVKAVMGHTRMTTQGSEMQNCNNHPFYGVADGSAFALAHNGILSNDKLLRLEKKLPASRIETDSFAIVQLLEQAGTIDLDTLRITSELLRGSFTYIQSDGTLQEVNSPYPIDAKFRDFGAEVLTVNGHDFAQLEAAFQLARGIKGKPTAILAQTVKGKGVSFMENQAAWHGKVPNEAQYQQAMKEICAENQILDK